MAERRAPTKIEISGYEYTIDYLPPEQAMDLFIDLFQSLAPALGTLLGKSSAAIGEIAVAFKDQNFQGVIEGVLSSGALEPALKNLVDTLSKEKIKAATAMFKGITRVREVGADKSLELKDHFTSHFTARFDAQLQWFLACVKVQYADFFGTSDAGK